jgi:nucleoside-diphosphate-sugar epimerase
MKVAITGATGFIGYHVLTALIQQGYEVLVVGRRPPKGYDQVTFVEVDLLQEQDHRWISAHNPSHLVHIAWYAEHGKYWTSPLNLSWCDATLRLIQAFADQGGERVVVAGTCAEYDWDFGYCQEGKTPCQPTSLYGTVKDCTRRMAEKVCDLSHVSLAWGRVFMPFGVGENPQRLLPSVVQALSGLRQPFTISLQQWRDILPVEVLADGFAFLTNHTDSGTFNICSGQPTQLYEVIIKVSEFLDKSPNLFLDKADLSVNSNSFLVGDSSLMLSKGWQPQYNLWDALQVYVKHLESSL